MASVSKESGEKGFWVLIRDATVRRGFSAVDLCVVVLVIGVVVALAMVRFAGNRRLINTQRDTQNVRFLHRSLVLFSMCGGDSYVRPSLLDTLDSTVGGAAAFKDTTSNIVSILIYQNFITPQMCVSPLETNPAIRVDSKFEYLNPKAALVPAQALWDPGFNTDFTAVNPARAAGFSYAHVLPIGLRGIQKWGNSFNSNDAIIANRGPKVTGAVLGNKPNVNPMIDRKSNTLLIHRGKPSWQGHVAYNDNSVVFETSMAPEGKLCYYTWVGGERKNGHWNDLLFYDEPENIEHTNNYLVNVKKIGEHGPELIWD